MKKWAVLLLVAALMTSPVAMAEKAITVSLQPLYQRDFQRYAFIYNGVERTVATSGCAMVCLSMALTALRPDVEQTPETLLRDAHVQEDYHGEGFSIEQIRNMAKGYDLELTAILGSVSAIRDALMEGSPVLVATTDGVVFDKGHYVLIYGVDAGDSFKVVDPGSVALSRKTYRLDAMFPKDQKGDMFFAFRSLDEVENMERRVNGLVQDRLPRERDAR